MSCYIPNGRALDHDHYQYKLRWLARLEGHLARTADPAADVAVCGDFNIAPADIDVWDIAELAEATHVSVPEREALTRLLDWGLTDVFRDRYPDVERLFSWWDYRAGNFHKNFGMRIDHLLVTRPIAERLVWAEIDREARKGKPIPSDHAPLVIDIDEPGRVFDAGWTSAEGRIAVRRGRPA
jgi:exodeoxyribonuclease-3